jgi:hypothetical protein
LLPPDRRRQAEMRALAGCQLAAGRPRELTQPRSVSGKSGGLETIQPALGLTKCAFTVGTFLGLDPMGSGWCPTAVKITAGDAQSRGEHSYWHVAKSILLSQLSAQLETGRLRIPQSEMGNEKPVSLAWESRARGEMSARGGAAQ